MWNSLNHKKWRIIFKSDENIMTPFNHNHLDYYSFVLIYDNKVVLNDSGGGSYDPKLKDIDVRLPEYHNSIRIKGLGYKPDSTRYFTNRYINCIFETKINKKSDCIEISLMSSGFNRIDENISFTRLIRIYDSTVVILDNSFSNKQYPIEHYFHFPVNSKIKNYNSCIDININEQKIKMINHSGGEIIVNENKSLQHYSEQYGQKLLKNYIKINSEISKCKPISYTIEIINPCAE
tara:strand:+ start:226 stop:930 length:705 start_codon:yes stop_codon:yes gene_type:complete